MSRTNREEISSILHYKSFERVPVLHFGFWVETLQKWEREGYLKNDEIIELTEKGNTADGNEFEFRIAQKLGFDDNALVYTGQKGNWYDMPLFPTFESKIIETYPDGSYNKLDCDGIYVLGKIGVNSIPSEIDHTLKDRASWEKHYLPKLQWSMERLDLDEINNLIAENETRTRHLCVYAGSLFGKLRNYFGLVGMSYLQADDLDFFQECVDVIGNLSFNVVKNTLETGVKVDFAHFWEDICYNRGSLFSPKLFRETAGKHYRRIADECNKYGVDIISVDCDGFIEDLIPTWLDNGVNTMFPIEFGAWEYDFSTMRKKFGKELRGIGNINKHILAHSRAEIDKEIERARRLVDLGGFVPCLDHRIAPDAEWDLVKYYCDRMRTVFS